ncbi:MAG TPA: PEGA domain-containing protein [Thermotogota bacterium]|nr:PEGA domain-containing protein [Thermotogota bacterium]HPJ88622.1 PEGA domain-containing protein [Thermotogota bacterium]HPR97179.1 PEGA domain-containing protein [Thermotogota bacterium]
MKKKGIIVIFFVLLAVSCLSTETQNVATLLSFQTECRVVNSDENGVQGITVSLYCIDFSTGEQRLFLKGISDKNGFFDLVSQTDTRNLPEKYAYHLVLSSDDLMIERIIDGQPELFSLLDQLKRIVVRQTDKTWIVDDEWSTQLRDFEKKIRLAVLTDSGKEAEIRKILKYLIITEPENAEIYINGEYIGVSPIELTLPVTTGEERYVISVRKDGYETEMLIISTEEILLYQSDLIEYRKELILTPIN